MGNKLKEFLDRKKAVLNDKDASEMQHKKGRLTARERLAYLLDKGSFVELDAFAEHDSKDLEKKKTGVGVIVGYGKITKKPL